MARHGWGTIIYLAAITGIDGSLYEAATVDGAGRWRKIWNITLPCIKGTIVVMLIMQLGRIMGSSFERPYTLSNPLVQNVSDVIATFVYREVSLTDTIMLRPLLDCSSRLLGLFLSSRRINSLKCLAKTV